ncbi:UbiA family prenyltransferase [Estrella lausannensis]|uniref:Putative membrane protein n=1 Tax=Estrella lausannensis TaxID=483423 RepID=A0A0H5DT89_9BACT|nr:UbiA family prenyltransferase [Estrella lausannensis]CRX39044.1 putative membrane protein [Estrella lausannensis]
MDALVIFVRDRVPLRAYLLLSFFVSLAPYFLLDLPVSYPLALLSFVGVFLIMLQMRLLDDIQDVQVDRVAHPERPFASGEVSVHDGERLAGILQLLLLIFGTLTLFLVSYKAFFFYITAAVYIWNNYKWFFFEEWMKEHPVLSFCLGELAFFPVLFFVFSVVDAERTFGREALGYSFLLFFASMVYNVVRKLDPKAHPAEQNFVHLMGYKRVFVGLMPFMILSLFLAESLGFAFILWPAELTSMVGLIAVLFSSSRWGFASALALLSLFIHAAAPLMAYTFPF